MIEAKGNIVAALNICTRITFETSEHNSDRITTTTENCQWFLAGILDKVNLLIQHSLEAAGLRVYILKLMRDRTINSQFGLHPIVHAGEYRCVHREAVHISMCIGIQLQYISEMLDEAKLFKAGILARVAHLYDVQVDPEADPEVSSGSEQDFD